MADIRAATPQPNVRVLVLSRGAKRNALSRGLISELRSQVRLAEADGIRSVVITGEGPAFSAGADFADLEGDVSDVEFDTAMWTLTSALADSDLISVAAIHGPCVGAGLDLAMGCDFRVAAPDAIFALPAVKMGILYSPWRLAQILKMVSHASAMRLLLLADRLDRTEAHAAGIVTHLADQTGENDALHVAISLASRAATLPPKAQRAAKDFVTALHGADFNAMDWQGRRMDLLASDERREALRKARDMKK